jgi:hypothetical protein
MSGQGEMQTCEEVSRLNRTHCPCQPTVDITLLSTTCCQKTSQLPRDFTGGWIAFMCIMLFSVHSMLKVKTKTQKKTTTTTNMLFL